MRDNLDDFTLNTKNMAQTAEQCKSMADKMSALRAELREAKDSLLFTWAGEGRDEFEKQFRLLDQQFSDIVDDTMNMYEEILAKEEAYIQADTDAAKQMAGADTRV